MLKRVFTAADPGRMPLRFATRAVLGIAVAVAVCGLAGHSRTGAVAGGLAALLALFTVTDATVRGQAVTTALLPVVGLPVPTAAAGPRGHSLGRAAPSCAGREVACQCTCLGWPLTSAEIMTCALRRGIGLSDGIQWLIGRDDWTYSVIFARGVTPEELALRLGGAPGSVPSPITGREAWAVVMDHRTDDEVLIRIGVSDGWSFALEYGVPTGTERLAEISRGGVEAAHLDPQPDHPPKQFAYAKDGVVICSFGIGEEVWRWGQQPDFLLAELVQAGVLHADGEYARSDDEPFGAADRATLAILETRFGLALPHDVEERQLPAFVIR